MPYIMDCPRNRTDSTRRDGLAIHAANPGRTGNPFYRYRNSTLKILLFPVGSAGDVHPMVGLGRRLADRGHDVTVITSGYFRDLLDRAGLPLIELGSAEDFRRVMQDPGLWHPTRGLQTVLNWGLLPWFRDQYNLVAEHYEPGNTLVVSAALAVGARIAQEKLGVPMASVHLQPAVFWSEFETPVLPPRIANPR